MKLFHNTNLDHILRWLPGCLIFLFLSCSSSSGYKRLVLSREDSLADAQKIARAYIQIDSARQIIRNGDLITRTGSDFTSESLRSLNQRDQTYSHCGIASIENDSVFVYHALGGDWNPDQKIRRDPLEVFADPYNNRGIGTFRFSLQEEDIRNLMITVKRLHELGVMFDMKFDLESNDHMYCAEFVYKSYVMGTSGKLRFNISHIGSFAFIGVDDLFLQPHCTMQKKIIYK